MVTLYVSVTSLQVTKFTGSGSTSCHKQVPVAVGAGLDVAEAPDVAVVAADVLTRRFLLYVSTGRLVEQFDCISSY